MRLFDNCVLGPHEGCPGSYISLGGVRKGEKQVCECPHHSEKGTKIPKFARKDRS